MRGGPGLWGGYGPAECEVGRFVQGQLPADGRRPRAARGCGEHVHDSQSLSPRSAPQRVYRWTRKLSLNWLRGAVNLCAAPEAGDDSLHLSWRGALTPLYQSPWTTSPLCRVTIVALAIQSAATGNSGQLLVCCQCLARPAGDS